MPFSFSIALRSLSFSLRSSSNVILIIPFLLCESIIPQTTRKASDVAQLTAQFFVQHHQLHVLRLFIDLIQKKRTPASPLVTIAQTMCLFYVGYHNFILLIGFWLKKFSRFFCLLYQLRRTLEGRIASIPYKTILFPRQLADIAFEESYAVADGGNRDAFICGVGAKQ